MKYGRTILAVAVAATLLLMAAPQAAEAEFIPPGLRLKIGHPSQHGHGPPDWLNPPGHCIAGVGHKFRFQDTIEIDGLLIELDIEADADPYINASLTIQNTTGEDQIISQSFQLDIDPVIIGRSLTGGSISINLMDRGDDGALLTSIDDSTPIYMSKIDGNYFKELMEAEVNFTAPAADLETFGPERFGPTPGVPTVLGPAVNDTIGIDINAVLSAGDEVNIFARFVVIQDPTIPEPGTMALLAIGGASLLARRKRRRA